MGKMAPSLAKTKERIRAEGWGWGVRMGGGCPTLVMLAVCRYLPLVSFSLSYSETDGNGDKEKDTV